MKPRSITRENGSDAFKSVKLDDATAMSYGAETASNSDEPAEGPKYAPSGPPQKKFKKGNDLYKPPTSEELNNLREAETLFHSSLFRLQTAELLKEVKVKDKWKKRFDKWLQSFKTELMSLKGGKQYELNDFSWLKKKSVKYPIPQGEGEEESRGELKGVFQFHPPSEVQDVGSFGLDLISTLNPVADLALTVPKEFWQHGDYLNQRYNTKRALYLCHLCWALRKSHLVEEASFTCPQGDPARPALILTPKGSWLVPFKVCLLPHPPAGFFKLTRFSPSKNNVRPSWYFQKETQLSEEVSTPVYNAGIAFDLLLKEHTDYLKESLKDSQGVPEALVLLRAWLHHRALSHGYGAFSVYLLTMFVSHLLSTRRISRMMSSYQVIRNVFLELAQGDWMTKGPSLCKSDVEGSVRLEEFHQHYPVVFVGPSGSLNLCANVNAATFSRVKHEAQLGIDLLNSFWSDSFEALFMTPVPFTLKFDHFIHLPEAAELEMAANLLELDGQLMDRSGHVLPTVLPSILKALYRALGNKVILIDYSRTPNEKWPTGESPPTQLLERPLTLGLLLDPEHPSTVLERGPSADQPEAAEFRSFWGERSELRRFQDGSICEAVLWSAQGIAEKRLIPQQIALFALEKHCALNTVEYVGGQLDPFLDIPKLEAPQGASAYGIGEEAHQHLVHSLDELSKALRQLKGLSLSITSVKGISPVFRFTQVFPPLPSKFVVDKKGCEFFEKRCLKLKEDLARCPPFVQPLEVVLHLEGSGKWPDNVEAVQRVKGALHLQLAQLIREQLFLTTLPYATHLDVIKDGYVFRLRAACRKELVLLKQVTTSDGMLRIRHTEEYHRLNLQTEALPELASTLRGIQQEHSVFGVTCRFAKRWLASHLLLQLHVPEVVVELLVAHLFLHPAPFSAPNSPISGFVRFLSFLTQHDWKTTPLIVNLNQGFKKEDMGEIQSHFTSHRPVLPPMFLSIPQDQLNSSFTRKAPSGQILQRLTLLAKASLQAVQEVLQVPQQPDFTVIFKTPLDIYDAVIHLHGKQVPSRCLAVDPKNAKHRPSHYDIYSRLKGEVMPVVDFDPVRLYLRDLQDTFEEFALFFYDIFGGDSIAVVWKPKAFEPLPFKPSHVNSRKKGSTFVEGGSSLVPNMEAILEDFALLGSGIVQRIETKTEKWAIS